MQRMATALGMAQEEAISLSQALVRIVVCGLSRKH